MGCTGSLGRTLDEGPASADSRKGGDHLATDQVNGDACAGDTNPGPLPPTQTELPEIPANTWVYLGDCPGDVGGREVPPGRASTWAYDPVSHYLYRYGGYTPRFSNALDAFDPVTQRWVQLWGEDENYPVDRPGGGASWSIQYDPTRARIFLAAGLANGFTGSRGVWAYNPADNTFEHYSDAVPDEVARVALDVAHGLLVASPATGYSNPRQTQVFDLNARTWTRYNTPECPQDIWNASYPSVYDENLGRVVVVAAMVESEGQPAVTSVWSFDAETKLWQRHVTHTPPPAFGMLALAYDPHHKIILVHGVKDPSYGDQGPRNDTWVLDVAAGSWRELVTPGPSPLVSPSGRTEIVYKQALAYHWHAERFILADPDLGVWGFRYDPGSPMGVAAVGASTPPAIGAAAQHPPALGASDERLLLPSALNPRIQAMPENSLLALAGESLPGSEVGFWYDSDVGVFIKYGGCGNHSSPFWTGYGNDLVFYDPGTERMYTRRVGDVSGALRPGNGCTRSVVYDSSHRRTWFFGGVGSGPYCQAPAHDDGSFAYDFVADRFELLGDGQPVGYPNNSCAVSFSPSLGVGMIPGEAQTWEFDAATALWTAQPTPELPDTTYGYTRVAWASAHGQFIALRNVGTAEAPQNATFAYDPSTHHWADLAAANQPPFRGSKFGLVYDSVHDLLVLLGGSVSWNTDWRNDLWLYSFATNAWTQPTPQVVGGGEPPAFTDNMPSGFDERHGVVVFTEGNRPWAYRVQ